MNEQKNARLDTILPWVAILLLLTLIPVLFSGKKKKQKTDLVAEGISFLAEQASKDPNEVERQARTRAVARLREEREDALEGGSLWGEFRDSLVLGDSRAVGFRYYHFLDPSRVIADAGYTIRDITDALETVKSLAPAYVYLCYGLNDTGHREWWATAEDYAAEFDGLITELQAASPGVKVIVSSILPATEGAMEKNPVWRRIPEFNEAVKAMCKAKGVAYAENAALAEEYMNTMWDEADGVHLHEEFYPIWAKNLLMAAIEADLG